MAAYLSPLFGAGWQALTNTGVVLAGGKIYTYVGGSVSTAQATWTDSTQVVQNANPIVLDSAGRVPNEVWLSSGAYKFVLQDSVGNTLGTWDNISGVNNVSVTLSEWIASGLTPAYVTTAQFTVAGNQTSLFLFNRRIQYKVAGGTFYGYVTSSSFDGSSTTTVNIAADSTALDVTLYEINYSLFNPMYTSMPQQFSKLNAAQTYTAAQRGSYTTLTDAATIAVDLSLNNFFKVLLGGNRTLGVPTNIVQAQSGVLTVYQDGTGSRTLAYAWVYQFSNGTAPPLSTSKYTKDTLAYNVDVYASATITITIAAPGVVTWTAHGLYGGQRVQIATTGALPTGLSTATSYYIVPVDANSFQLATSLANAQAGTAITTTGSQSGTHTMTACTITLTSTLGIA